MAFLVLENLPQSDQGSSNALKRQSGLLAAVEIDLCLHDLITIHA